MNLDSSLRECLLRAGTLNLDAGVYTTNGVVDFAGLGYRNLRSELKIQGKGVNLTTIKVDDLLVSGDNGFNVAFTSWHGNHLYDVEISDLTIDCNYIALQTRYPNLNISLRGVVLFGSNCTLRNVRVINSAGFRKETNGEREETFVLALGGEVAHSVACVIDNCSVDSIAGGYISAISMLGSLNNHVIGGQIKNCKVVGRYNAAEDLNLYGLNLQYSENLVYTNNQLVYCQRGIGNDTGTNKRWIIKDNLFDSCGCGIFLHTSQDTLIKNNVFRTPGNYDAMRIGSNGKNALFTDNTVVLDKTRLKGKKYLVLEGKGAKIKENNTTILVSDFS